jgi:hypothetical protein
MKMSRVTARWLSTIGLTAALGVGATVGLSGAAGASSRVGRTRHQGSAGAVSTTSFSFNASVSGLAPTAVTITGSGQADFKTDALWLSVNVPAVVTKLIPGGSASPEVINVVESGGTVYLKVPTLDSLIGTPWIAVALPSKTKATGEGVLSKVASALGNVHAIVSFAEAHHATVTPLPPTTVDGVHATGNQIVATLSHKGRSHPLTASVWADSSDQLVQGNVSTSLTTPKGTIGLTASVNFSGYGAPVTVTVPPSSQVKTIPFSTVLMFLGKGSHSHARV